MQFTPKKKITEDELSVPHFDSNRTYDAEAIKDLILNSFILEEKNIPAIKQLGVEYNIIHDDPELILDNICQNAFFPTWSNDDEMEADELESKLLNFAKDMKFNQEELNELAEEIKHTKNPKSDRIQAFRDELESDLRTLRDIKAELITNPASVELGKLIERLEKFEYSGNKNETWDFNVYNRDKNKYTLLGGSEEDDD